MMMGMNIMTIVTDMSIAKRCVLFKMPRRCVKTTCALGAMLFAFGLMAGCDQSPQVSSSSTGLMHSRNYDAASLEEGRDCSLNIVQSVMAKTPKVTLNGEKLGLMENIRRLH